MTVSRVSRVAAAFVCVMMTVLSACGSGTGPGAPFRPLLSNLPDDFQFQASRVRNATWTYTYTWSNSGIRASVNQISEVTGGTGTLTILDAGRTQVYTNDLKSNGTYLTSGGAPGNWTVKIAFTGYSGNPNIRLQKS